MFLCSLNFMIYCNVLEKEIKFRKYIGIMIKLLFGFFVWLNWFKVGVFWSLKRYVNKLCKS